MKYLRYVVVALLALALVPANVTAQQLSKGSIQGTVTDTTGAVVPDAKVVVSSSLGTREAMTGSDGYYLVLGLEPGKYTVKVEKQGFKAVEFKDVDIRLNERTNVNVKLEVGAVTQVVEVSETSVSIDTSTTTSGGSVTSSIFLNAPVGRNITDIPYLVAGVNDGLGTGASNPSISGATGFENLYVVNGVNITNTGYGAIGTFSNVYGSLGSGVQFDFVKEVQVKTSGFEAQYGQALGGVVNMITKSGGNSLFGGGYFYLAPDVFEAERKQPNAVRTNKGTETLGLSNYDLGGELGGYFVKDRVFWYGGYNAVWARTTIQGPSLFRSFTTVGETINQTFVQNYSGKLNLNVTPDQRHQVEVSIFGDPASTDDDDYNRGLVSDFPDRRVSKLEYGSRNLTVRYNGAWTNSWLVNFSYSWAHNKFEEKGFPNIYGVEDRTEQNPGFPNAGLDGLPNATDSRGLNQIGGIGFFENNEGDNHQFQVNGTNTFRTFGGSHQLDYGYQFEDITYDWFHRRSGPDWPVFCQGNNSAGVLVPIAGVTPSDCGRTVFGAQMRLRIGGPSGFRLQQIRGAFTGQTGSTESKYHAIYLQDSWQLNKWITLKLGVRWEQQHIQGEILGYTFAANWAPRLGIIVDPWADRKTKIFFNFGRFFEKVPQDLAVRSLSEERSYISYFFAVTNPTSPVANWNSTINPTPGCSATDTLTSCLNNPANWILDQAHVLSNTPIFSGGVTDFAPGTKAQYQDEYVVGIERDFGNGLLLSARYLDRRIQRVVEDVAALTVGGASWATDIFGNDIHQTFLIANPSRNLDIFTNTLCHDGTSVTTEDPTIEGPDPFGFGIFVGCLTSGGGSPGYNPGAGDPIPDGLADGFPNPVRRYRAFEFQIEKRFTKNWQLLGNWRISKLDGNYEGLFRNDNGQTDPNITSLFDFPFSTSLGDQFTPGVLPTDRRHIVNVYASYLWDNGFNMGLGWRLQSGYPIDRLGAHPAYLNQGEVPKNGRGSEGRSPVTSTIDWHGSYTWKMTERYRMSFVADIFNLWNARRIRRIDRFEDTGFVTGQVPPVAPNPDFLGPTGAADAYQRPLYARFAIRFQF